MAITQTIKELVGLESESVEVTAYRCTDCGHEFESAKDEERAQCMECLSQDVEPAS